MTAADQGASPVAAFRAAARESEAHGEKFAYENARFGALLGLRKLGCGFTILPPGKSACPFHNHRANEELFVILAGEGEYRFGDKTWPVKAGDLCAAPAGGPETAHHLINTGAEPLEYLAISTMIYPEIVEYPDSGKFLATHREAASGPAETKFRILARLGEGLDYWDGE